MELKKLLQNRNNRLMLGILIIGLVIIIISSLFDSDADKNIQSQMDNTGEEARLSEILSQISGAGRVSVMVTYENKADDSYEIGRGFSDTKGTLKPRGVIVVADGASLPEVRSALREATAAVMGIGYNRVAVYSR